MLRSHLAIGLAASLLLAPAASAQAPGDEALAAWFAAMPAQRGDLPGGDDALTRAECEAWLPRLVAACRAGRSQGGAFQLPTPATDVARAEPGSLQIGAMAMPFVLLQKGERPAHGWPLWICLHGGGGNDRAAGPHAWEVNSREWDAQQRLVARVYAAPGLYFVPRMADDRKGRWWFDHNQQAFDEVIRSAVLFCDVDPDRIYLMGISEGGYGAIRFAGNRPDRFAACGGMAAAEPLTTSPPENMRNVAMRIDIGEKDTMYDRIGLARRMGDRLAELRAADAGGYDFEVHVQAGRGHGIDYSLTPQWLATKVRNPRPSRVVWTVRPFDTTVDLHCYWLALAERPTHMPLRLTATRSGNRIDLDVAHDGEVEAGAATPAPATASTVLVRLDDSMVDFDQPIAITVNGVARQPVRARRSLATMARTLAERCDPRYCFPFELAIDLAAATSQDSPAPAAQEPPPMTVSSRAEIDALSAEVQSVVGIGIEDDELPALLRLRRLETLELRAVVPSPFGPDQPLVPLHTLSDDGLLRLATLKSLRRVTLVHQHGLTARGLDVLARMPALEHLALVDSDADDLALAALSQLRLTSLQLTSCWRTGRATLQRIAAMPTLRTLRLEHGTYATEWLLALGTMNELVELHLDRIGLPDEAAAPQLAPTWRHAVTDELLRACAAMQALRLLTIQHGGITPAGVRHLRDQLPQLEVRTGPGDLEPR